VRLGQSVASIAPREVRLTDGAALSAATVVWSAGIQASPLTQQIPGHRDRLGQLDVDEERSQT
jgi:NADH dehydrogenase